jgi:hypothetical protein
MLEHALRCLLILMVRKAPPTERAPWAVGLARSVRAPYPRHPPSRSRATPLPPAPETRDVRLAHRLDLLAEAFRNPEPHALRMAAYIKARGGRLRPVLAIRPDAQALRIVSDLCAVLPTVTAYPVPDTS